MAGRRTGEVEQGLSLLRRLSDVVADAFTADQVARAALTAVLTLPGVVRAGLALRTAGGRQLQFASTDEDSLTPTRVRWCLIDAYADVPLNEAVRHDKDVYVTGPEQLAATYPGFAVRQAELGVRGLAALSLSTDAEQIGGLLVCFGAEQPFDDAQRWLFGALAAQLTQAVRKGIAYQVQHTTAEQLQRSLMPRSLPDLDGLDLGSHYRSGGLNTEVGGDWYDVVDLADGSTVVAVGDVMGKGAGAAVAMGEMRAALRAYAMLDPAPGVVLSRLDAFVAGLPVAEQLVTLAYGLVAADRSTVRLGLAGHPPPLLLSPNEATTVLPEGPGSALGVGVGPWPETTVRLAPDRSLLLYSDGLVETRVRSLASGIGELLAHVESIPARRRTPRELCARLAELMTDDGTDDDVTLLAVAVAPAGSVRRASVRLAGDELAPREARRFLRATLENWDVEEDTRDAAELCLSELVTNAVIHTGTSPEVTTQVDQDFLTVLVRDGGSTGSVERPPVQADDPLRVSGRGLQLIELLTSSWAAEQGADGTTVWFEIERDAG